jgi:hypothetical protein
VSRRAGTRWLNGYGWHRETRPCPATRYPAGLVLTSAGSAMRTAGAVLVPHAAARGTLNV